MASLGATLHIRPEDVIEARQGSRDPSICWISIGNADLSIFAPPAKMIELRDAIDAFLAMSVAPAEAA